jgi:hypothetical protein
LILASSRIIAPRLVVTDPQRHDSQLSGSLGARLASCTFYYHCTHRLTCSCCFRSRFTLAVASSSWSSWWFWLSSLVRRGLLGLSEEMSRYNVSLQCQDCRLGKHTLLPYHTSESVSQHPFDLVHSCLGSSSFRFERGSSLLCDIYR